MRLAGAVALFALLAGCAPARHRGASLASVETCEYVVRNATGLALEIRRFEERRLAGIANLNPGEQITESARCAEDRVYVLGIPIPRQVGVPTGQPVFGFADLESGKRAQLTLSWP
jgi:hypothetical protein